MNSLILPLTCVILVFGNVNCQQHQVQADRQVRLEDIERENLKTATQQQQPQQPQQTPTAQYAQAPLQYQQQYLPQQYYTHQPYSSAQLPAYQQQVLLSQSSQQPVYVPQNQPLPFPVMLIPSQYLLPQHDINSLLALQGGVPQLQSPLKYRPAQLQQVVQPLIPGQKPFRPSQPLPLAAQQQYQPQYNAYQTIYQQKFPAGAKSTATPPLKDSYVQPASAYNNYKLQQ